MRMCVWSSLECVSVSVCARECVWCVCVFVVEYECVCLRESVCGCVCVCGPHWSV